MYVVNKIKFKKKTKRLVSRVSDHIIFVNIESSVSIISISRVSRCIVSKVSSISVSIVSGVSKKYCK